MPSPKHSTDDHDDNPQPPRLDPEHRALRDMWLAEMWPVCHQQGHQPAARPRRTAA